MKVEKIEITRELFNRKGGKYYTTFLGRDAKGCYYVVTQQRGWAYYEESMWHNINKGRFIFVPFPPGPDMMELPERVAAKYAMLKLNGDL